MINTSASRNSAVSVELAVEESGGVRTDSSLYSALPIPRVLSPPSSGLSHTPSHLHALLHLALPPVVWTMLGKHLAL